MSFRLGALVSLCVTAIFAGALLPTLNANSRVATAHAAANGGPVGMFEAHGDVGKVLHPGTTEYDPTAKTYTITGSGNNMWMTEDDFQFAWKKMSGDVGVTANTAR